MMVRIGMSIGKVESMSLEVSGGGLFSFGAGMLYDARTAKLAAAIRADEIDGEIYSDGEIWANPESLSAWEAKQNQSTEELELP